MILNFWPAAGVSICDGFSRFGTASPLPATFCPLTFGYLLCYSTSAVTTCPPRLSPQEKPMNHQESANEQKQSLNQAEPRTFPQPGPHVAPRRGVFTVSDALAGASPAPGPPAPRPANGDRAPTAPSYLSLADPYLRKIAEDNARCQYRDSAGRRCRRDRQRGDPTFCTRHRTALLGPDDTPSLDSSGVWEDLLGPLRDSAPPPASTSLSAGCSCCTPQEASLPATLPSSPTSASCSCKASRKSKRSWIW